MKNQSQSPGSDQPADGSMKSKKTIKSNNLFPVVGIGASAGGLAAFKKLLHAIPEDSGMAYVLVQHLDPKHESMLPELLQKVTSIPVLEIKDDVTVEPNHIYVIPSNKIMVASDGVLQLSPRPESSKNQRNLPIDLFFTSLAEVHQAHAIGVVLSGTASDGTAGLKAIKDHGGITFAQDEESADYGSMPNSAVQAGVVDFILTPEEIPQKILEVHKHIEENGGDERNLPQKDVDVFKHILSLLRIRKGTDFTYYKPTTIRRRILRRMALNKNAEPTDYLKYLRDNKAEQDVLYQDLLIPVTSFFRDTKSFDHLCESVFPLMVKNKTAGEPLRIWVAGCSTGQEAYSLAICLKECLGVTHEKVQIFATDISEPAIEKARSGIFTKSEVNTISPQRLKEFFTESKGEYHINKQIRDMCVFATHNFLKDPPFGKMDFISCRNVLIYMEPYLQKKALSTFHYALHPKGFLFLGKTETTSGVAELFASAAKNDKLFSRKEGTGSFMHVASQRSEKDISHIHTKNETVRTDFQKTADDIMLSKYTPAGVVVNEVMDIVHFRGSTGTYLEQSAGKPSHNLLSMAKDGLAFELRNILHKAKKEKTTVLKENIPLEINGILSNISIEAIPLSNTIEPHYLILFHDHHSIGKLSVSPKKPSSKIKQDEKDLRIQQLGQELAQTREDMRSITEDQEAVNEELQSANEELLSGSEELQSLNEELETSKEELQSTNEELIIVNQELLGLNEQVTSARNYAEAIVATIREPLLVLDKNLRVKTANNSYCRAFGIKESEIEGRLIYEVDKQQWDVKGLRDLLEKILPEKSTFKDFEISIGDRVMLLNASEMRNNEKDEEKLILLAIEDISERKHYQQKETELHDRFKNLVIRAPVAICIFRGPGYVVELANERMLEFWGKKPEQVLNKKLLEGIPEVKDQGFEILLDTVFVTGKRFVSSEFPININRNGEIETVYVKFVNEPLYDNDGNISGIMVVADEITEEVLARKTMEVQATMVHNLMMTAPGFVCTLSGPEHIYSLVNDRYQALFGKRRLQGKPILEALPELEGQGIIELLDNVYKTGEPFVGIDVPISLARDENLKPELRYFNFSYQPIYDENKHIYSILVFGYEVTDQVNAKNSNLELQKKHGREMEEKVLERTYELSEANELLLQKNEELLKMNKELKSFAYVSSHDLREPLRKIHTFSDRLLEKENENLSEAGKDYLKRMQSAAGRMQQLIEDLLTFSRINTADRKLKHTELPQIVEEVKTELAEMIAEKQAIIDASKLGYANVIPFQFRQLINNLVSNALKFAKRETPPHIIISSEVRKCSELLGEHPILRGGRIAPEKECCHINFTDNGIGFEPHFNERIFEVFQKLHRREDYDGTGIGLAIVKRIVENHNGIVTAKGELGKGASFDVFIPV